MGPLLVKFKLLHSLGAGEREPGCGRGEGRPSEESSWNAFSHSHTLVNIPESQSWEELTDQYVQKALTLGSLARLHGRWTSRYWMQKCSPVSAKNCIFLGEILWTSVSTRELRQFLLKVQNTGYFLFILFFLFVCFVFVFCRRGNGGPERGGVMLKVTDVMELGLEPSRNRGQGDLFPLNLFSQNGAFSTVFTTKG